MGETRRIDLPPYSFWETRAGAGLPVILIHGLGGSSDWWRRNIDVLAERYQVSAVDLVGFGRNRFFLRGSSLPLKFDEIAALLARWIESSFREPVHVVGNSMGGQIAIHLAASRPDLVRSLVLVDSTGIPFELQPAAHLANLMIPRGAWSFATVLARDLFRAGPTSVAVAFSRLLRDDARPLLRALRLPVLLLWGSNDPLVPLSYGQQMLEEIPNAKLRVIENAGHIPMWENPAEFHRELLTFFDEVDAVRSDAEPEFSWALAGWTGGIAHRAAGRRNDVVLVHGLGMSSAYFRPFARAMFERGWNLIAPDLPGFGASVDGPPAGPREHAAILARWADALSIRDAVWIGHSLGCNDIEQLKAERPDLVSAAAFISPLWTNRHPLLLFPPLVTDAIREPIALLAQVAHEYWRVGLVHWFETYRRYFEDIRRAAPQDGWLVAGERDPLVRRDHIPRLHLVAGAHACHFSFPQEVAEVITRLVRSGSATPERL